MRRRQIWPLKPSFVVEGEGYALRCGTKDQFECVFLPKRYIDWRIGSTTGSATLTTRSQQSISWICYANNVWHAINHVVWKTDVLHAEVWAIEDHCSFPWTRCSFKKLSLIPEGVIANWAKNSTVICCHLSRFPKNWRRRRGPWAQERDFRDQKQEGTPAAIQETGDHVFLEAAENDELFFYLCEHPGVLCPE